VEEIYICCAAWHNL